ncbi:MAG TPA: DUF5606 domain-containing protein [Bacteroidia bacterium]|nr:DUF5606 domain-containing protein [Bacteroidia bacterium]
MDISNIISMSGMPGLYKVIAQSKSGVIVESLIEKKRFPAFASNRISTLEDISIYTTGDDLPLKEVYKKIFEKEKGGPCIDPKSSDEKALRAYIETVIPEYDKERVHISDLRKLFSWYNILQATGLLAAEEPKDEAGEKKLPIDKSNMTNTSHKNEVVKKQDAKSNAPKVKAAGVRKSGLA